MTHTLQHGILVLGAGGHGKVVADILMSQGLLVIGFLDDDPTFWGQIRLDLPVLGAIDTYASYTPDGLVMGVGDNKTRRRVVERLGAQASPLWMQAVHPRAIVARSVRLGQDVVIAAGAVINPDAAVGDHVIVNTGATVDHDCIVDDYAHIAPGAHLSGDVRVGEGVLVGIGGSVAPGKSIGDWAVVGAGAVVVRDVPGGVTAIGVPARWQR